MQADIKNRNGRVYPMEILQKEVERYNKNISMRKDPHGELGHPDGPNSKSRKSISYDYWI